MGEFFGDYMMAILAAAILSCILDILAPSQKRGMEGLARGVIIVVILALPLTVLFREGLGGLFDFSKGNAAVVSAEAGAGGRGIDITEERVDEQITAAMARGMAREAERFLKEQGIVCKVTINLRNDGSNWTVESINILADSRNDLPLAKTLLAAHFGVDAGRITTE